MRKPTFWFSTWSDADWAVRPQKMDNGLKFGFRKQRGCTIYVAKTVSAVSQFPRKLICVFVLHMQNVDFHMTRLICVIEYHISVIKHQNIS